LYDALRLRKAGLSYAEIGRLLGVSRQRVEDLVKVAAATAEHPIARLAEAMGSWSALARAAGVTRTTVRRLIAGREPSADTCERMLALLDRLEGKLDSGLLEEAKRYLEERRPARLSAAAVQVPVGVVLGLGDEVGRLSEIAREAALEALADARAGRPLRPGPARIGRTAVGFVPIRLSLPLEDMRELQEAAQRDGRSLTAVVSAYMERRAGSSH
jgi:transcriptional regulator with XRE-family HTH domain